jgi:hypothetical protein
MRTRISGLKTMWGRAMVNLARYGIIEALGAERAGFVRHVELVSELHALTPSEGGKPTDAPGDRNEFKPRRQSEA